MAAIPGKLEDLIGFSVDCVCGHTHRVEMLGVSLRRGAIEDVVRWSRNVGSGLSVALVADRITWQIAGENVRRLLEKDGQRTRVCVVPDSAGGRPHADEKALDHVESALDGVDLVVAVGSGTINDLAKLSSFRRHVPYLAVPTAPSMNGYTSAIAAVTFRGVKRTIDCHQPRAVIADLDLLGRAPRALIAAGLGDLESKPTATADYRLAGWLRGEYYCPAPEQVVLRAEARVAELAEELGRGDPLALAALAEALLLSGIAMKLAGSSSPASGGEHLISHHWDMTAAEEGRVEGWHGAQVGVTTIVTAALYEELRLLLPQRLDIDAIVNAQPGRDELERQIRQRHGKHADEVAGEFFKKYLSREELRPVLERVRDEWEPLWVHLGEVLRPASRVREILKAAGAPVTVGDLGLTPTHLRKSLLAAREIRGRFTVLDFAADLGVLQSISERVLQRSACL